MKRWLALLIVVSGFCLAKESHAQFDLPDVKVFGYFQTTFQHWSDYSHGPERNSFSVQQLNLFFQTDLSPKWTSFINFEVLNNFSSGRHWGALNLQEAWIKYRANEMFTLKLGLQIPIFNNLNEIRDRTPLLPYIIRPLVYETSFEDFIATEDYLPRRAFVQTYGFIPFKAAKIDYAVFVGNSPDINDNPDRGTTGVDTTTHLLLGGRLGIRYAELKAGFSFSHEKTNTFQPAEAFFGLPTGSFADVPRIRLGGDLSYNWGPWFAEGELIWVQHDEEVPGFDLDRRFYYGTLGYRLSDYWQVYGSYWYTNEKFNEDEHARVNVPNFGLAYNVNDRIICKAHYAYVTITDVPIQNDTSFHFLAVAMSVFY